MLKILLVEDEINVVEGMKISIEWEKHGFIIAGEAYNGKEGLEKALKLKPDIVITDITMPVMDGIEMAEKVRGKLPGVKLVFLTCHEDFNYARHAMKLDAEEYLIKMTMTKEDLYSVLDRVKKQVEEDRLNREKDLDITKELNRNRYGMGEIIINEIIRGSTANTAEGLQKRLGIYGYRFSRKKFIMGLLRVDGYLELIDGNEYNDSELAKFIVLNITEEIMGKFDDGQVFSKSENEYILMFNFDLDLRVSIWERIRNICEDIQASIRNVLRTSCTIYVGKQFDTLLNASQAYRDIRQLDYPRFYTVDQTLIFQKDLSEDHGSSKVYGDEYAKQLFKAFGTALGNLDYERMQAAVHSFVKYSSQHRIGVNDVKNIAGKLFAVLVNCIEKYGVNSCQLLSRPYTEVVNAVYSIESLGDVLCQYSKKTVDLIGKTAILSSAYEINRVLQYVNEHICDDITLDSAASHVNMNSSYFSRYFKSKTGENFVDYLAKLRIEKARELLLKTQLNIDTIAEQVGHINKAYFAKVFKKFTGVTPGEYRKAPIVRQQP